MTKKLKQVETKECPKCGEVKDVEEFYEKDPNCKDCKRIRQRELYKKKKDMIKDLSKKVETLELQLEKVLTKLERTNLKVKTLESSKYYPNNGHREEVTKIVEKVLRKERKRRPVEVTASEEEDTEDEE